MRRRSLLRAFVLLGAAACGGVHNTHDAAGAVDATVDATIDAPPAAPNADIATTLQCGPNPPVGDGGRAELQLATLDPAAFPDARCNDGSPAVFYFRPYTGAANRNKWVLNLHGGGSCNSAASCAARWCGCSTTVKCPYAEDTTNFDRSNMMGARPPKQSGDGVFLRGGTGVQTNPIGDWNQAEFVYCSSDAWRGTTKGVSFSTVNPMTNDPVTYTIDFLGAKILDADLAWLRHDGAAAPIYTLDGGATAMPDLDDATDVIVTGDSGGGEGTITNLDYIHDLLAAHTTQPSPPIVAGLIDAIVGVDRAPLDYGTYKIPQVRTYDQYLTLRAQGSPVALGARLDESCRSIHATDPRICHDESHVIRNHVTTPFFVRMALRDSQIGGNYVESMLRLPDMVTPLTINNFAVRLHDELTLFGSLGGEEALAKEPGVFAPGCTKHDTIHDNSDTYLTTITDGGGTVHRLMSVFERWRTGAAGATVVITQSPTLDDTQCPNN